MKEFDRLFYCCKEFEAFPRELSFDNHNRIIYARPPQKNK